MSRMSRRRFLKGSATAAAGVLLANTIRPRFATAAAPATTPAAGTQRKLGVALVGIGSLSTGQLIPGLTGLNFNNGNPIPNIRPTQFCKLVAFVTGRGFHAVLALLPMVLGAALGAGAARTLHPSGIADTLLGPISST